MVAQHPSTMSNPNSDANSIILMEEGTFQEKNNSLSHFGFAKVLKKIVLNNSEKKNEIIFKQISIQFIIHFLKF